MREVIERHGGNLPPDAVFRPDDDESARAVPSAKPKRRGEAAKPRADEAGPGAGRPPSPDRGRSRSERFAVLNAFIDFALADLTSAQAKVWLILFRDTKRTGLARTGQADIARRAGLKVRMVRYALRSLEVQGMVDVVRRGRLSGGPSVYRVHPTGTA
jgi:hypothetical protein